MGPPPTHPLKRPRSRSTSLSIARSPSVLAASHFLPPVPPHDLDPSSSHSSNNPFDHPSAPHHLPHPRGSSLARTVSASGADRTGGLAAIASVEDLTSMPSTADALLDPPSKPLSRSYTPDTGGAYPLEADAEAPLLARSKVRFHSPALSPSAHTGSEVGGIRLDGEADLDELERMDGPAFEYTGPFQPPDSKEMLAIILSFGGVLVLSVAAGLTTIYDWVL
ncbi:hypothetical protein IAT38_007085 [Cryptococcus sp. DSM 104549]